MPIKELRAYTRPVGDDRVIILTSPCYRGRYYPAPAEVPVDRPHKPYVQIGEEVKEGQPLCRIRETLLHKRQEYLILSPRKGILIERTAELGHLVIEGEFRVLQEGFWVGMGATLFTLQLIQ